MASGLQVVTEFITEVRRFVLINSDHKSVMSRWAGVPIHIPGREETALPDKDNPTAFVSATDKDGSYIPGTLVITDRYGPDGEGGEQLSFDAGFAVRDILGVHTRTGLANSAFARRGLSLLPRGSTRADLERIRKTGYARSEAWRVEQARMLVQDIDQANAKRVAKKLPEMPGGHDYVQAILELKAYQDREQRLVAEVLRGEDRPIEPIDPLQPEEIDQDRELADYLKAQVESATVGVDMDAVAKQRLVEKMVNDPEAMAILRRKFKMVERLTPVPVRKKASTRLVEKVVPPPSEVQDTGLGSGEAEESAAPNVQATRDTGLPPGVVEPQMPASPVGMGGDLPAHIQDKFNTPDPIEEKATSRRRH